MRTIVVGGGIAGLSAAWQLASDRDVVLLERESALATHSSARNAQIWLPVDPDATTGPLARRSAELLTSLLGAEHAWLRRDGAVVLAGDEERARRTREGALAGGLSANELGRDALRERAPEIEAAAIPLWVEGAGVLEPSTMLVALAKAARGAGAELRTGAVVKEIVRSADAVRGVVLEGGEHLACDEVVIAAGAWAQALAKRADIEEPLEPLRRHLVVLSAQARSIVWCFGDEPVYWRPESGGVLASPCDEVAFDPCLPPADPAALELLASRVARVAPSLVDAPLRTSWACLRTFAPDRELVLGPDPRLEGLAWVAGLGGRGMTVGVAAAELCAEAMRGRGGALAEVVRPARGQSSTQVASTSRFSGRM